MFCQVQNTPVADLIIGCEWLQEYARASQTCRSAGLPLCDFVFQTLYWDRVIMDNHKRI